MKKLSYLLLTTLFVLSYSCSKDDDPEEFPTYKFKIDLEFSGDYLDYKFKFTAGGSAQGPEPFKNTNTGEQANTLTSDITESSYQFESVNELVSFTSGVSSNTNTENLENAFLSIKIYRDNKLFHEENITFIADGSGGVSWAYVNGELIRTPKL